MQRIRFFFSTLGALRSLLVTTAVLLMIFVPKAGTAVILDSWAVVPTLVVPTLMPMLFMIMMLDMLMSRILMAGQAEDDLVARQRFRYILIAEAIVAIILAAIWTPYFMALGS
jgi:membrane-anchored glycerophosphoryl diester phosphodiesterase (GDPDase)